MTPEFIAACDEILNATINGVWQGILLVLLVAAGLRFSRRSLNAATRHAVWFAALLLLVFIIPAHYFRHHVRLAKQARISFPPENARPATTAQEEEIDPDETFDIAQQPRSGSATAAIGATPEGTTPGPSVATTSPADGSAGPNWIGEPWVSTTRIPPLAQAIVESANTIDVVTDPEPTAPSSFAARFWERARPFMAAAINPTEWNISLSAKVPKFTGPIVLASLLLIAAVRVCLIFLGLHRIRKLKARVIDPDDELSALFDELCRTLKVRRPTALRISTLHRSPLLLGFLHPVILLPAEQQPDEVAAVLRHELAHVNRRDDWANLAQHAVLSLLFFHPAARWVSKRLTLEREIACDDHVLHQGDGPRGYALLLANLAGRMQGCPPLLAPGASTNKSQLQQRIDMILDPNRNTSPRLSKSRLGYIVSSAMALAIAAIYCAPRIVLAQTRAGAPAAAAPATPAPVASAAPSIGLPEAPAAPRAGYPTPAIAVGGTANDAVWTTPEAPDVPAAGAIPPGAKYKPGTVVTVRPGIMTTPEAPGTPSAVMVAPPPIMTTPVQAFSEPRQPMPPRPTRPSRNKGPEGGLEERLARLEEMVQSLVAQQNSKPGGGGGGGSSFGGGGGGQSQFYMKGPDMQRMQDYAQTFPNQKELEKMKEMAEREARLAVDQAKRAARDGEKAAMAGQKWQFRNRKEASQQQLEGLRRQLEALERQREMLDRQIEEIERSQDQLDDSNDEEQADVRPDKPADEVAPKPAKK